MARFTWDPDVNITKRKPAGMTSKVDPNDPDAPVKPARGTVTKSKQFRKTKKFKSRLAVQGTEKRQSQALMKHWRYRNFKKCGSCGEFDTYESRNPEWTRTTRTKKLSEMFPTMPPEFKSISNPTGGDTPATATYDVEVEVKFWCYKCGAINDDVTKKYEHDDRFDPKGRKSECADCGAPISFARGELAWPTGETDPATHRPDYRCDKCEKERLAAAKAEKEARKLAKTSE